jgi:hypothetical protein
MDTLCPPAPGRRPSTKSVLLHLLTIYVTVLLGKRNLSAIYHKDHPSEARKTILYLSAMDGAIFLIGKYNSCHKFEIVVAPCCTSFQIWRYYYPHTERRGRKNSLVSRG